MKTTPLFASAGLLCALVSQVIPAPGVPGANWVTFQSVKQIPRAVLEALQSRFHGDSRLADRDEPFDATDLASGRPRRRFVLAGRSGSEWFLAYEHGGRGHHLDLVVFDLRAGSPRPVLAASLGVGRHDDRGGWRVTLADLLPTLTGARGKFIDDDRVHY
jgi:hypothetical protein